MGSCSSWTNQWGTGLLSSANLLKPAAGTEAAKAAAKAREVQPTSTQKRDASPETEREKKEKEAKRQKKAEKKEKEDKKKEEAAKKEEEKRQQMKERRKQRNLVVLDQG